MEEQTKVRKCSRVLNCDEMAWLLDVFHRYDYIKKGGFASISRMLEFRKCSAILEIMEILNLEMDEEARHNLTPGELRGEA